jgi:hypothetical protein
MNASACYRDRVVFHAAEMQRPLGVLRLSSPVDAVAFITLTPRRNLHAFAFKPPRLDHYKFIIIR